MSRPARMLATVAAVVAIMIAGAPAGGASPPTDVRLCQSCGEPIHGAGLTAEGGAFHADHFRCAHCGKIIDGAYAVVDGDHQHYRCAVETTAPRCAVCEQVLVDVPGLADFWGNLYHAEHEGRVPQCEYCGRFIAEPLRNRGQRYADGREVCGLCLETALSDPDRARVLLVETATTLARHGLTVEPRRIELHLVDRRRLAALVDGGHGRARGVTVFRTVRAARGDREQVHRTVYLLAGMPETEVRATLAHELVHVWQGERRRLHADPAFLEGSCNYATWLVLAEDPGDRARYIRNTLDEDPDPIYGEGFRRVRRFAEERGREAWLERLRQAETLPGGY